MECKKHSDWLRIQPMRHSESAALDSDSDSDSEYFIDPRGEILFIPTAPCKVEMETSDKE